MSNPVFAAVLRSGFVGAEAGAAHVRLQAGGDRQGAVEFGAAGFDPAQSGRERGAPLHSSHFVSGAPLCLPRHTRCDGPAVWQYAYRGIRPGVRVLLTLPDGLPDYRLWNCFRPEHDGGSSGERTDTTATVRPCAGYGPWVESPGSAGLRVYRLPPFVTPVTVNVTVPGVLNDFRRPTKPNSSVVSTTVLLYRPLQ